MLNLKNALYLLMAIGMIIAVAYPVRADEIQKQKIIDYRLEAGTSEAVLYPRLGYRSSVAKEDAFASLADLERRVGQLPAGSRISWQSYERDSSGNPALFLGENDFEPLKLFCRNHGVELIVTPPNCATRDDCKKYCEGAGKGKECMPDGSPLCSKNECSCALTCR